MPKAPTLLSQCLRGINRRTVRFGMSAWALPSLGLLLVILGSGLGWYVIDTSKQILQNHLVESAEKQALAVTRFRNYYAEQLLPRATSGGIAVTHLYKEQGDALPLPATLAIEFGKYWAAQSPGEEVKLFSDHPFPWRETGRQLDSFQTDALAHLRINPSQPYTRKEVINGEEVLRYAQADRMQASCVACHNSYPNSPKTDWKLGDVRGALEVRIPVQSWKGRGEEMIFRSLGVLVVVGLTGLGMVWLILQRLQAALASTRQISSERKQANERLREEIQERQTTERYLRLSESKLQSIFESAPEGIVVMDTVGVILQANLAAAAMFGYPLNQLIGQNIGHFVVLDELAGQPGNDAGGIQSVLNNPQVIMGLRRHGETFPLRISMTQTRVDNDCFFAGVMQDFTQIKANEAQLDEARIRAEVANRLKGELLANMSHEIRTPMNGIVGMTQLVLDTPLSEGQRQHLALAQASAHHLLHIINDILDFSKMESGTMDLELQACSPRQILEDSVQSLASLAAQKSLQLDVHCASQVPEQLMLDPVRLRQILTNLVGNAIKFTPQGRVQVFMDAEAVLPGETVRLLIRVKDSGIGFKPSEADAIFHPFVQADGTSTRSYGGTGLGLAITRSLVTLMGGHISAESEPDRGSEFKLHISCERPGQAPASKAALDEFPDIPRLRPLHILLAEDHPINQMLAGLLLNQLGHSHATANNGQEALDRHGAEDFDLILMDVMMPIMDGLSAMALVREREASSSRRTPIVVVTAHAMTGDRERFLAAGADGYVSKPISAQALQAEMRRVMDLSQTQGPAAGDSQTPPNFLSPPGGSVD